MVAMPTGTSSPAFVAFVSFVVGLHADLGERDAAVPKLARRGKEEGGSIVACMESV
jgi:hypothetical protein